MLSILEFIFSSFYVFCGVCILISIILGVVFNADIVITINKVNKND